jgi:hypothetical protein
VSIERVLIDLRHANIDTTQASYILPDRSHVEAALKKFAAVAKKYGIKL